MAIYGQNQSMLISDREKLNKGLLYILSGLANHGDLNEDIPYIKFLLGSGADPNVKDRYGKTLLHYIAERNDAQGIRFLLEAGANPNAQDQDGKTPLHYILYYNQSDYDDAISALLNKNARIDIQDESGNTPLHYAADNGHINGIKSLIECIIHNKQDVNLRNKEGDTAFHIVLSRGDDERCIDHFLETEKEEKKLNIDFSIKNLEGITPLLAAVRMANANAVKSLLERLKELGEVYDRINDIDDKYGGSMLHHAMSNHNIEPLAYNVHSRTQQPDFECKEKHEVTKEIFYAITKYIREDKDYKTKYINRCDYDGNTPLFVAVDCGMSVVAELLINEGADVSVKNKNEYTVFHRAIRIRSLEMLKTLLPKKEKRDESGVIVTDEYGYKEIDTEKAKKLLSVIDKGGNTLLHHAVKKGCSEEIINFLVEYGVDINEKNKNGVAPIHIAAKYGHPDLISCLIKNKANCSTKCGNLTKSHIDNIGKECHVVIDYINVQGSNSTINIKNDTDYEGATPVLIAADGENIDAVNVLASWGIKHDIQDDKGWDALLITIKRACSKDCTREEKQKMYKAIRELASDANSEVLGCLTDMKHQVLEEQLRDRIKSLATSRRSKNDKILNVSIMPQVTGGKLGNLVQMSIETRQQGQGKHYISKLFSKDKLLEPITDKEVQMYEKRVCDKLKNIIGNVLELSGDKEVQKIVRAAFHDALSAIESRNSANALVGKDTSFDDGFYEGIGSGVKEAPKLYSGNVEQKNMESCKTQEKELSPEMDRGLRKFKSCINEFWENAESATRRGKLRSLEVDDPTFFLEYSEDSIVEVAKITDGMKELGLNQGDMAFGSNIVKLVKVK